MPSLLQAAASVGVGLGGTESELRASIFRHEKVSCHGVGFVGDSRRIVFGAGSTPVRQHLKWRRSSPVHRLPRAAA